MPTRKHGRDILQLYRVTVTLSPEGAEDENITLQKMVIDAWCESLGQAIDEVTEWMKESHIPLNLIEITGKEISDDIHG